MIGILGGTFDPIHSGHLLIAEVVRNALQLEKVLFVPAGDPPHKQQQKKTAARHRVKMVELAIESNPYFSLSTVDLERPGPHYSIDTVRLIRARYNLSSEHCFFIVGGDSLVDLPTWHKPEKLIEMCRLAVVHRPGYRPDVSQLEQVIPGVVSRLDWVTAPAIDLAASEIRARAQRGESIRYQVPEVVAKYIKEQGLYPDKATR